MNEQYPDNLPEAREEELIRRAQGDTLPSAPEQHPISREVAEEVVVRDVIARQVSLKDRLHADPEEGQLPKRPSLRDRLAADRTLNPDK